MDIGAYLKKHGLTQEAFASRVGVTQGAVWQWLNGSKVKPLRAIKIEEITKGEITAHELRPDLFAKRKAAA